MIVIGQELRQSLLKKCSYLYNNVNELIITLLQRYVGNQKERDIGDHTLLLTESCQFLYDSIILPKSAFLIDKIFQRNETNIIILHQSWVNIFVGLNLLVPTSTFFTGYKQYKGWCLSQESHSVMSFVLLSEAFSTIAIKLQ